MIRGHLDAAGNLIPEKVVGWQGSEADGGAALAHARCDSAGVMACGSCNCRVGLSSINARRRRRSRMKSAAGFRI